jgi:DivIVA domain-containing protein
MGWLIVALVILVLGVAIAMVVARTSAGTLPSIASERAEVSITAGEPITSTDLARIRFTQTLRGYAPDEVDDLLERLRMQFEMAEGAAGSAQTRRQRG